MHSETIYLAGGCLWGVQEFVRHLPGVIRTGAGRANGIAHDTGGPYDGYAECVQVEFDPECLPVAMLMEYLFEIIDPYSLNRQGPDVGEKYRTGVYSRDPHHLAQARAFLEQRPDRSRIQVEILPLTNYVRSDEAHQDRLAKHPADPCHIPRELLHKYARPPAIPD